MRVASYPNMNGTDLAVMIALSFYMNHVTKNAWPSFRTMAADLNRNPSSVWRSIKKLERLRFIRVVHSRSRHKSNRYVMGPGPEVDPERCGGKKRRRPCVCELAI